LNLVLKDNITTVEQILTWKIEMHFFLMTNAVNSLDVYTSTKNNLNKLTHNFISTKTLFVNRN